MFYPGIFILTMGSYLHPSSAVKLDPIELVTYGFTRESVGNTSVPTDISRLIVSYFKQHDCNQITSFSSRFYSSDKWKLSESNTCIQGIYSTTGILSALYHNPNDGDCYCVGFKDGNGKHAFDEGVHSLSLKYESGHHDHCQCTIGVIPMSACSNRQIQHIDYDGWSHTFGSFCYGANRTRGSKRWNTSSVITVRLDLNERTVTFYEQKEEGGMSKCCGTAMSIHTFYKAPFCFLICANPHQFDAQKFKVVSDPYYCML